jgi:dsDNA-specific endonuclease/ATPase MutS2
MMTSAHAAAPELLRHRNKSVAKSFYRQLKSEGFSHEQIIELSATLLDLVNDDMVDRKPKKPE